ncbi:MAG: DUF4402 domain-containing protein [Bdellovibrionota bacterium]
MKKLGIMALAIVGFTTGAHAAPTSDTASARATLIVKKKIHITKVKDLEFGEAYQGDAADTVAPADSAGRNAEFKVTGREGGVFTIDLPDNGTVIMTTGDGTTADKQVAVQDFVSNFGGDGATATIAGDTALFVGATRAAIADEQQDGEYQASFDVTVAYQ